MAQNIISGIVAGIVSGITLIFIGFLVSIILPKSAVTARLKEKNILRAMRYLATILLLALCWLLLPLNKFFVFSVVLLFAFIVLMLVYDYASRRLANLLNLMKSDHRQSEIDRWTNQLAMCDRRDTRRIEMIKAKLKELHGSFPGANAR